MDVFRCTRALTLEVRVSRTGAHRTHTQSCLPKNGLLTLFSPLSPAAQHTLAGASQQHSACLWRKRGGEAMSALRPQRFWPLVQLRVSSSRAAPAPEHGGCAVAAQTARQLLAWPHALRDRDRAADYWRRGQLVAASGDRERVAYFFVVGVLTRVSVDIEGCLCSNVAGSHAASADGR